MADTNTASTSATNGPSTQMKLLFWVCFIALVANAFGFVVRAQIISQWGVDFSLTETQKGEILGVGLWPFALSIILFSLVLDRIGYGRGMVFAWICHIVSAFLLLFAGGYWMLYIGTFLLALAMGTIEAVINPVVATMFPKEKTKWLNILHAGWPGGLVLGGLLAITIGTEVDWRWKVGLILIPVAVFGVLMIGRKWPIHERVKAGVSYKEMLQEPGILGALIVVVFMIREIGRLFQWSLTLQIIVGAVLVIVYGYYVRTVGRPMFIFLMLIMIPLATTELGTDSWITDLMTYVMTALGANALWVLVYTAFIMTVLRYFLAGPLVARLKPLGLLAVSSAIAVVGLLFLSVAEAGIAIFLAATLYGIGKTFFWPTMLGVVSERFPKGGALTINMIGGIGMLTVGVVGAAFLGNIQDRSIDQELSEQRPALHSQVIGEEKMSVFGKYRAIDQQKVEAASERDKEIITSITADAKKGALTTIAILPTIMLICYLILIFYFRSKGGYKAIELATAENEESSTSKE